MAAINESVTLEIERLAPGGDGMGHVDGQVCFVPLSAPGDRIRARIVRRRRRFLRGEIEALISAGPDRRPPPRYTASDLDPRACRAAWENLSSRGMAHVRMQTGDALEVYRSHGREVDLIVLDPPRQGHLALARALRDGRNRAVLYISCNPGTLARDLAALEPGGYKPTEAAGFDMFPQTAHLEAAVLMER